MPGGEADGAEPSFYQKVTPARPLYENSCPTCEGANYVKAFVARDHPLFGKMRACPTCWGGSGTYAELGSRT